MFWCEELMGPGGKLKPAWKAAWFGFPAMKRFDSNSHISSNACLSPERDEIEAVRHINSSAGNSDNEVNFNNHSRDGTVLFENLTDPIMKSKSNTQSHENTLHIRQSFQDFFAESQLEEVSSEYFAKRKKRFRKLIDHYTSYTTSYIRHRQSNTKMNLRHKQTFKEAIIDIYKAKQKKLMKLPASFNQNVNGIFLKYFSRNLKTQKVCADQNLFMNEKVDKRQYSENMSSGHLSMISVNEPLQNSQSEKFSSRNTSISDEDNVGNCNNNSILLYHSKKSNIFDFKNTFLINSNKIDNFNADFYNLPQDEISHNQCQQNEHETPQHLSQQRLDDNEWKILLKLYEFWNANRNVSLKNLLDCFPRDQVSKTIFYLSRLKYNKYIMFIENRDDRIVDIIAGPIITTFQESN